MSRKDWGLPGSYKTGTNKMPASKGEEVISSEKTTPVPKEQAGSTRFFLLLLFDAGDEGRERWKTAGARDLMVCPSVCSSLEGVLCLAPLDLPAKASCGQHQLSLLSSLTHLALALISLIALIIQKSKLSFSWIPNLYIKSTNMEIYSTYPQTHQSNISSKLLLLYSIMALFTYSMI